MSDTTRTNPNAVSETSAFLAHHPLISKRLLALGEYLYFDHQILFLPAIGGCHLLAMNNPIESLDTEG